MNPTKRTRPPHPLHLSGNTPQMRASNYAHKYCAGCPARAAPQSARTVFGRGALLPATSFRPACGGISTVTGREPLVAGRSGPNRPGDILHTALLDCTTP